MPPVDDVAEHRRSANARTYFFVLGGIALLGLLTASYFVASAFRFLADGLYLTRVSESLALAIHAAVWFGLARAWVEVLLWGASIARHGVPWRRLGPRAFQPLSAGSPDAVSVFFIQRYAALLGRSGGTRWRAVALFADIMLTWCAAIVATYQSIACTPCSTFPLSHSDCIQLITVSIVGVGVTSLSLDVRAKLEF